MQILRVNFDLAYAFRKSNYFFLLNDNNQRSKGYNQLTIQQYKTKTNRQFSTHHHSKDTYVVIFNCCNYKKKCFLPFPSPFKLALQNIVPSIQLIFSIPNIPSSHSK
ncbi:hypothetical protein S245_057250 [Arachis hypogaea]